MPVSPSTLIHFTKSKERLKSIFAENFRVGFCKEEAILGSVATCSYVPMVSFCDIPLSQIKDQIAKYGDYGIGLTRAWAIRNGLNPVLYVEEHSQLSASLRRAANGIFRHAARGVDPNTLHQDYWEAILSFSDLAGYTKNYQGTLRRRDGSVVENYRFADEREWRYVVPRTTAFLPIMSEEHYKSELGQRAAQFITETNRLRFDPNDIKYVIIKDDSEIEEFVGHLRQVKEPNYSRQDIDRLTTRILTSEQIKQDI